MDTLASTSACHDLVAIHTCEHTGFIDLTPHLDEFIAANRIRIGTLTVQTRHTTTAIVVNEHEPLLLGDFMATLERLASRSGVYDHDNLSARTGVAPDEPLNGASHCRALVLPCSVSLNVVNGRLALGRWQRVLFLELDGPRRREVSVVAMGEVRL